MSKKDSSLGGSPKHGFGSSDKGSFHSPNANQASNFNIFQTNNNMFVSGACPTSEKSGGSQQQFFINNNIHMYPNDLNQFMRNPSDLNQFSSSFMPMYNSFGMNLGQNQFQSPFNTF